VHFDQGGFQNLRKTSLRSATAAVLVVVCVLLAALCMSCGKVSPVNTFLKARTGGTALASTSTTWSFTGPVAIDAGTGAYESNNDFNTSCWNQFPLGQDVTMPRGCMQQPAIAYNGERWMLGFSNNYLQSTQTPIAVPTARFSIFASMTNILTRAFGTLGSGLGVMDAGSGVTAPVGVPTSSRYVRYATFPNKDVIAVWMHEYNSLVPREIWANIYKHSTRSWGTARLLSSGFATDTAIDIVTSTATFCRPAVATAGDNSAMITWCERDAGLSASTIYYRRYANGTWGAATKLIQDPGANDYVVPALTLTTANFGQIATTTDTNSATCAARVVATEGAYRAENRYIVPGDTFTLVHYEDAVPSLAPYVTVTAVDGVPGAGEFQIARDGSSNVQICQTMQNMLDVALATPATDLVSSTTVNPLASYGVSAALNPKCSSGSATDLATMQAAANAASEWYFTLYYNKGLTKSLFRKREFADFEHVNETGAYTCEGNVGFALTRTYWPSADAAPTNLTTHPSWAISTMVDIAGDALGNYTLVRSILAPYVKDDAIQASTGQYAGYDFTRQLVGHRYQAGSGWVQRPSAPNATSPDISFISPDPTCSNGTTKYACGVRHPKVVMSDAGQGLVLFYQRQQDSPVNGSAYSVIPNRLWYSTYSNGSGFATSAGVLDHDVTCSSTSTSNDASVCEGASYPPTLDVSTNGSGVYKERLCEVNNDPHFFSSDFAYADKSIEPTSAYWVPTGDVTPIAASMNASGKAVIAYHKKLFTGTFLAPTCGFIGTFVRRYDPLTGMEAVEQLDDATGDTMHAAVAVAPNGTMAVVWEQRYVSGSTVYTYVYLRVWDGTSWGTRTLMNDGYITAYDSMMPSVSINDLGEIVVSFTYSAVEGFRRQYANYYYLH